MKRWQFGILVPVALLTSACAPSTPDNAELEQQVLETEGAFARTMAERDHARFTTFLADEAIFFSGDEPIFNPQGDQIATFTSIWRLEAPGTWRIVFDKGAPACACP